MKIGIYGGSFDPAHKIHRALCEAAAADFSLDRVLIIPTAEPPHKDISGTGASDRFKMAEAAFCGGLFSVSDLEQKSGISYTCETLEKLRESYPADGLFLIIGGDSMRDFHMWKNPQKILACAKIIVVSRGEGREEEEAAARKITKKHGGQILFCREAMPDVSSTTARALMEFGLDASEYVDGAVLAYIKERGLYKNYSALTEKLRDYLDEEKYIHSAYVAAMGDKIARNLKLPPADRERVYTACILHDCGKRMSAADAERYGFTNYIKAQHGFLGAEIARRDFGITDSAVLDAIKYHTTSAPDMSLISKIVSVADLTEETRDFAGVNYYRKLALENIEKCFLEELEYKYHNLLKTKKLEEIEPHTKAAYDYYFNK